METFELYSLTSKLTLDTAQFDRAYTDSRTKMKTLAGEVNKLEDAANKGSGGVNTFGGSLSSLLPSLTALGGPAGAISIVTGGVTLMVGALAAAAAGVWTLTNRFSDIGSALKDMSDQVNFSVETLGTFEGVGKSIGVEVESLSTGLVTFQKNLAGGDAALKALGITSKDNEVALRQTFTALAAVNDQTLQTALAQEIFGKSGKAMMSVIKATGGDFDAAQEKLRKWNVLMSDDAIAIADEFGDKLGELGMRFQGIGNTIAMETAPAFIAAFDQIGAALDANQVEWRWWGEQLGNIIVGASGVIAGFIKAVQTMSIAGGPGAFIMVWNEGMNQAIAEMNAKRGELLRGTPEGMGGGRIPGPTIDWKPGGNKKERAAREKEDPIIRLMEQYQQQLRQLAPMTTEQKIREELLGKEYANSSAQMKALLIVTGMAIDVKKKEIEAQKAATAEQERGEAAYKAFAEQQFETLRQINHGQMTAYDQARVAMLDFMHVTTPLQQWWILFDAMLIDSARHAKELHEQLRNIADTTPQIAPNGVPPLTEEQKRGNILSPEDLASFGVPPPEDPMAKWRRMADDLSTDITRSIDNAITRGFEDGIGAGIKEFGLGILEMAKHEALNELARAMRKALSGGEKGEGEGGGWLSQLISFGVSAASALFGGAIGGSGGEGGVGSAAAGAIGGHAGGGFMFPNEWSMVGERGPELVKAGPRGASVMSNPESMAFAGMGGLTINQTIAVPSMYQAGNRQTQTQAFRGLQQAAQRGYSLRG